MTGLSLEERVAALEAEVAQIKEIGADKSADNRPWWKKIVGVFQDDPDFEEAVRLGREYREAQRPQCFQHLSLLILAGLLLFSLMFCARSNADDSITYPGQETKQLVRTAQYLLRVHGYQVAVNGHVDQPTRDCLRQFQRNHHLKANAVLSERTWQALLIRVKPSDKGDAVRAVQELLKENFKEFTTPPRVVVDGVYGGQTMHAVKYVQQMFSLKRDGIVGTQTWSLLLQGVSKTGFYD